MIDITTTISTATCAVRLGMPTSGSVIAVGAGHVARPVSDQPTVAPRPWGHAVAPTFVKTGGEVRLDDDATGFAGTRAWSPPT